MWAFSLKEISMERSDWELLDKQLRGQQVRGSDPRREGVTVLSVVAMFFAGMMLGGILFANEVKPMRIASNQMTAALACDDNGACRIRSHPPAAGTLVAL
jgi:hypothetical protein